MNILYSFRILCVFVISMEFTSANNLVVNTVNGKVVGEKRINTEDKSEYYAFHAIPYASPPVGNLRFKPPKEFSGIWEDTYNASDQKKGNLKQCAQKSLIPGIDGNKNEDCLPSHIS